MFANLRLINNLDDALMLECFLSLGDPRLFRSAAPNKRENDFILFREETNANVIDNKACV